MPITTPEIKIKDVKRFGAKIIQYGDNVDAALKEALSIAKKKKLSFVHPFDDPLTIAGQGTIGKEILEDDNDFDVIFVPVGGGGILAGVSAWVAQKNKRIKIIGVEVEDSACLVEAVKANKRVTLKEVGLFADGVAVSRVGKSNFDVIKECVDEVITVSVDQVCTAVKDIFEDTRVLSEPAGALALAGLKVYSKKVKNKNLIAISLILVISSCTTPGQVQQESEDRFNSMTTDSVELCTSVTGQGDPLETIVTFSTQSCYTTENGILRMNL